MTSAVRCWHCPTYERTSECWRLPILQYPRVELVDGRGIHMAAQNPKPKSHVRCWHYPTYERTSECWRLPNPQYPRVELVNCKGIHMAAQTPKPNSHDKFGPKCQCWTFFLRWLRNRRLLWNGSNKMLEITRVTNFDQTMRCSKLLTPRHVCVREHRPHVWQRFHQLRRGSPRPPQNESSNTLFFWIMELSHFRAHPPGPGGKTKNDLCFPLFCHVRHLDNI